MQFHDNLKEISATYNYFIFDIWGVIHDGSDIYPNVIETLTFLRSQNKKICFLSNAPRRSHKAAVVLEKLGIHQNLYDFILTSGEATFLELKKNQEQNFKDFGKKYFYIGPQKDIDLLDGLNYIIVNNASEADFAITTGFDDENSTLQDKMPQIEAAKKANLDLICVNPDLIVVKQSGLEMLCAGVIAKEYERIGGKVHYFGKPHNLVYKIVCENFNNIDNSKILAVGDALETDIRGASNSRIDSALVTGGILSNQLGIKYGQKAEKNKLEMICQNHQIYPKFVIPGL